ncbi:hypothetical protein DZA50_04075 [Kangiella sp. HD9-110m-PIT-SAG07]|nr:hypothetical protein DZA50_04075 [Kangiella sp. HD9-110m-PIT-SAG07]
MEKTLLTLSTVFGLAIASSAMANEAESMKQQELRACDMQAQQLPKEVRAKQQESCKCVVENTDYDALVEAKKSGDMAKVQQLKDKASQACRGPQ